ncbi:MAG TPA: hypothetical protein EYN67_04380 [Flavobacteriales bacterium]|nr:hypothetical protein [Flavobacteriales bacterium]
MAGSPCYSGRIVENNAVFSDGMEIKVGDLVRIRGVDWLGKRLGIVTEIKNLMLEQTGTEYRAITALVGGKYFTFTDESFELVSSAERKKN